MPHDGLSSTAKSDNAAQFKIQKQGSRLLPYFRIFLLTDTQLSDQGTVTVDVLLLQVSQHRTTLTNHLQQTAARVVILLVYLQVLGQLLMRAIVIANPELGNRVSVAWVRFASITAVLSSLRIMSVVHLS